MFKGDSARRVIRHVGITLKCKHNIQQNFYIQSGENRTVRRTAGETQRVYRAESHGGWWRQARKINSQPKFLVKGIFVSQSEDLINRHFFFCKPSPLFLFSTCSSFVEPSQTHTFRHDLLRKTTQCEVR